MHNLYSCNVLSFPSNVSNAKVATAIRGSVQITDLWWMRCSSGKLSAVSLGNLRWFSFYFILFDYTVHQNSIILLVIFLFSIFSSF